MPTSWRAAAEAGLHRLPVRLRRLVPAAQRTEIRHRLGCFRPWEEGADLSPPPCGPDETAGPPAFVGIGTTGSGAGGWYRMVVDHPGISVRGDLPMARHFLSHFAIRPFGPEQVAQYHGWFPRRPGAVTGEWSPGYSALPWVPVLLARAAPDARLLLMVRNPIERFRLGLAGTEAGRGSQVGMRIAEETDRGFYGAQLRRVLEYFAADRVLVLQSERCAADPMGQLAATYRFLGVDDSHRPLLGARPAALGARSLPEIDRGTRRRLVEVYAEDVADVSSMAPGLDLSLWPEFGDF
jgi:hypothetical protein